MSITSDLEIIKASLDQAKIALKYRQVFREKYQSLCLLDVELETVTNDTKFIAIPASIKQPLNVYWQEVKVFIASIENNPELVELLGIEL